MSVIVTLALLSMMSSMFVSDNLDGDAAHINIAGSLRMQSVRISRALIAEQNGLVVADAPVLNVEVSEFEGRLHQLEISLGQQLEKDVIATAYQTLTKQWSLVKNIITENPARFRADYSMIDQFVETIDGLVFALQKQSEVKIRLLRIIQSVSMFLILLTAFTALLRINKSIVQPMNQLVRAASEAGKGNFSIKTSSTENNEIGLLARTFNDMSEQLQAMHDNFEERVREKTSSLEQRNKSLELLYQTTHNLVKPKEDGGYHALIQQIEDALGGGKLMLCLRDKINKQEITTAPPPLRCYTADGGGHRGLTQYDNASTFSIKKNANDYGFLSYSADPKTPLEQWQHQLLQTIADNIAVSISLDKKRSQEALLGLQEERAVIARELHDSLAQSLSYLKLQTSLLKKQLDRNTPRTRIDKTITDLRDGLSDAYRQLRELLTTFRLQVGDASLESALKATAVEFTHKCGHPVELNFRLAGETLSPNEQIHVLQIVREALSNIQRHAQASEAKIMLQQSGRNTLVRILDNGRGLPNEKPTGVQYGLSIMNERAQSLGAHIEIRSNPDGGTEVRLDFVPDAMRSMLRPNKNLPNPNITAGGTV